MFIYYELEEQLMDAVRQGRTAQALRISSDINYWSKGLRFMSDRLGDQIAGASTLRTLVRHAALQAGLTPVLVDTLSQEYAQKMHAATDSGQLTELIKPLHARDLSASSRRKLEAIMKLKGKELFIW